MGRNLVICCDGTNNSVVGGTTNVLRLFGSLVRDESQLIFYDSGVGTLTDPTRVTPLGRWFSRQVDMAVGNSLGRSVSAAYRFLCQHWQPGDEVYLFGFSRGAYAARALAGMVHFLGLLRPELDSLTPLAWNVYADENRNLTESDLFAGGNRFAKHFSRPEARKIPIHFLGVWDTVSSFGWIWDVRSLPHSSSCPSVQHVRHAAAIDETRAFFPLQAFRRDSVLEVEPRPRADEGGAPDPSTAVHASRTFREVWFAGVHSDVGGGYEEKTSGLSKISLEWMLREAEQAGLRFDPHERDVVLGRIADKNGKRKAAPDPAAPIHDSSRGLWPLLEFVPKKRWDSELDAERWYAPNLFRRRPIPPGAAIHPSVMLRIDTQGDYRPGNLPAQPNYTDLEGPL